MFWLFLPKGKRPAINRMKKTMNTNVTGWSGGRESNPRRKLGKLLLYH